MPVEKFKGSGLGTSKHQSPISVKFPPEIDTYLRSLPDRSEFIRQAVAEKMAREQLAN